MKIIFALLAYLVGSFPSGYVFFRWAEKKDVRRFGSQSTGATNIFRLKGWKYALPVLFIDVLKGFFPAFLALRLFSDSVLALTCAFLAVVGHCFPVYIKFKGGKGVATAFGAMSALAIKSVSLSFAIFLLFTGITRYVSLGSLLGILSIPLFVLILGGETRLILLSLAVFCIILIRHLSNIQRLWKGEERKFGQKIGLEK